MLKGLTLLTKLNKGIKLKINGSNRLIYIFTMALVLNMPKAAKNIGIKGISINKFYYYYFIPGGQKANNPKVML